jgi:small multidrug resistance pump
MPYLYLSIAILSEVVATSALKATEEFTRLWPSVVCLIGYGVALYGLNLSLRTIPVGIAYAAWAGLGTVLVALVGVVVYQQRLDLPAALGIGLIIAGVTVINVWSGVLHE